ncbi:MAG TPA: mannose-1-phosphate guanylyltransferase, partial [Nitrospirae bacterium]|nr:mannose-1-phosphate guanylyltransferase [Nitrospirota bacterium]
MKAKSKKKRNNLSNLYTVIIAGGSGTRFWPLSREETPKQLLSIDGKETLIQATVKRACSTVPFERTYIVTGPGQAESIRLQLNASTGVDWDNNFIIEPEAKNTAPAIGLAAIHLKHLDPDAIMVVLPSDHIIRNKNKFRDAIMLGAKAAEENYLVTIGIKPDKPETGYGYIKSGKMIRRGVRSVKEFREKPAKDEAIRYLRAGGYFWNSGIFIWRAEAVLNEIKKHMPGLYKGLMDIDRAIGTKNLKKATNAAFPRLKSESIDYGVLEKARKVAVAPSAMKWSDVGSWHALDNVLRPDIDKNIKKGNLISIDNENSILYCGNRLVAAMG